MATLTESPPTDAVTQSTGVTLEEFAEMDDPVDAVLELDAGEVIEVTRAKHRHGRICNRTAHAVTRWLDRGPGGEVATNDAGVITDEVPDSLRGPDVYYFCEERMPSDEEELDWLRNLPDLCVEVRSPSETWASCVRKAAEYLEAGSPEVWIVEPDRREVHVYTDQGTRVFTESDMLVSETLEGFSVPVAELFRRGKLSPEV